MSKIRRVRSYKVIRDTGGGGINNGKRRQMCRRRIIDFIRNTGVGGINDVILEENGSGISGSVTMGGLVFIARIYVVFLQFCGLQMEDGV